MRQIYQRIKEEEQSDDKLEYEQIEQIQNNVVQDQEQVIQEAEFNN